VEVTSRSAERAQTLTQVSARTDEVRATIDGYGERVEASALRVTAQVNDRKPTERVVGYVAHVTLTVMVVDFTVLGDMLMRLAEQELVTVQGPYWALRPDSPVYREARTHAVRDARTIAEEYAAAAGSRLTGLVEISDTGLGRDRDDRVFAEAAVGTEVFGASRGRRTEQVTFEVEPAPQTVQASVQARFTLAQFDFS
jgi:uncharacterized protein YggE